MTSDNINNMPPQGNEPLQNAVIQPPQQQQQMPQIQMNVAERIGVTSIVNAFHQAYHNNFAPQLQEFNGLQGLERLIYFICRDIDTKLAMGYNYNTLAGSDALLRRIAMSASLGLVPQPNIVPFENLPFNTQMFLMNLTVFVIRFLNRNPNQNPNQNPIQH